MSVTKQANFGSLPSPLDGFRIEVAFIHIESSSSLMSSTPVSFFLSECHKAEDSEGTEEIPSAGSSYKQLGDHAQSAKSGVTHFASPALMG